MVNTNNSYTVCECDHLTTFGVLMEEQSVPIVIHLPAFHVEIIVGAVISVLLLITIIVLFKVKVHCASASLNFTKLFHRDLFLFSVPGTSSENAEDSLLQGRKEGIRKLSQESKFFQWNKSDAGGAGGRENPDSVHQPVQGESKHFR